MGKCLGKSIINVGKSIINVGTSMIDVGKSTINEGFCFENHTILGFAESVLMFPIIHQNWEDRNRTCHGI